MLPMAALSGLGYATKRKLQILDMECSRKLPVPSLMITFLLGDRPSLWQDRF